MKHITSSIAFLLCSLLSAVLLTSCGKDYQDDIDKLNATHASIEKKVVTLETQVETINSQLQQLALLATAIENHFYLTEVVTTADGYEITLSNGRKIILQKGPQNTLVFAPAISMTQIGGFFFWTLNGTLILDGDGNPLRTSGPTPIVKYNILTQQWVISVDNGITFQDINVYASITLNQELLMQIINNFVEENKTTLFNQTMLYQIISTYIQLNYAELFDVRMLNDVIYNYVHEHYTKIFSYELLEKIFNQYNFKYYTDQIDVDALVDIILSFIRENQSIFLNNEVLFEIISNYMEVNKSTIFDDKLLLEVINNFIQNNQNYINVELLTQIVFNYIDQHEEIIVNNKVVQDILIEYVQKNYTHIFQQNILVQILNNYIMMNRTDVINQTLIEEILNNYIQNHYTTLIDRTVFEQILNRYITVNETSVIDRDILIEVIANYFDRNYNLFIDRTFIQQEIQNYIDVHQLKIIDVDIIEVIVNKYIAKYYKEIFDTTILTRIIENYFVEHTTIIEEYVTKYVGATMEYSVGDLWATIIYNGESVRVPVYGKNTSLRNNVQSVVVMPGSNGKISWTARMGGGYIYDYSLHLDVKVTPYTMANYIRQKMWHNEVTLELVTTDGNGNINNYPIYEAEASDDGKLSVTFTAQSVNDIKAVALHIKENTTNATDIMTNFVVLNGANCSGIPDDPTTPTPSVGSTTITIPYPNIQTAINDCGNCVATLTMTGIQHPSTKEWMYLYGTGLSGQNVWIDVDDLPKGNTVVNLEDNTSMVQNDIVFTVDNSSSMGQEADAIARDILSWAQMLTNKKLNVKFGVVGYGGYIDGAINLTNASSLSNYLNAYTGVKRTMHYGGSDSSSLESKANNYTKTGNSTASNECGAMAIRFANDYFSFRQGANRIYINFTDEPNQPNGNSGYSVNWFKSQANWPASKGTVHTVYSDPDNRNFTETANKEKPWRISEYTGGTTMFVNSDASNLQLDKLAVSDAMTHSYTIRFLVPRNLVNDGMMHAVRITVISKDNMARGELNLLTKFDITN